MRLLAVSGSTRHGSFNTALARLAAAARPGDESAVIDDLHRLPFYDADVEAAGVPAPVAELRNAVAASDGVVLVTPEYNGSVPGVLSNAVDWLSRPHRRSVLQQTPVVVMSASPSPNGATWAAEHLRKVLRIVGAAVSEAGLSVPRAYERLAPGHLDPRLVGEVAQVLDEAFGPVERAAAQVAA